MGPESFSESALDLAARCRKALEGLLTAIGSPSPVEDVWPKLETDPLYREAVGQWDGWPEGRRQRQWDALCRKMEQLAYSTRPYCRRCGECCRHGSPSLVREDLPVLKKGKISRLEVMTLRRGEIGFSSERQEPVLLEEERIKIKEKPGSSVCLFYEEGIRGCRIYPDRPFQCRLQACWNPERYQELAVHRFLNRKDLLSPEDPLWPLIESHERRCHWPYLQKALSRLRAGNTQAGEEILEAVLFDRQVRRQLRREQGIEPQYQWLLIGRPLEALLTAYGFPLEERNGRLHIARLSSDEEDQEP